MFEPRFSFADFSDQDDPTVCRERHVYDAYGTGEHRLPPFGQWQRRFDVEALEEAARLAYRFQGHRQDTETSLVNFQARDFNPSLKAWVTQEPARYVDGLNVYLFSRGEAMNPVNPL